MMCYKITKTFINISLCILSAECFAEYRAYQYLLRNNTNAVNPNEKIITSSYSPQSFKSYYGGKLISVELLRTWMCYGHTGRRKPICPSPEKTERESRENSNES